MKKWSGAYFVIVFLMSLGAGAQSSRLHASEDYEGATWGVLLGGTYTSRVLKHDESSTNPNYVSSDRRVRVDDVRLSLTFIKELLNPNTFSITVSLLGGVSDSSGTSQSATAGDFEEKLESIHYGAGLSLNYNLYAYGLKLQPYLGVNVFAEEGSLNLFHSNGANNLNTIHDFEAQVATLGLGIRAFDADHNLMSYFEISSPQVLSETLSPSGRVDDAAVPLTSNTPIDREAIAFSLGFGYYF